MLTDTFGRNHDYLRISITDNCNLRCFYCMPDEDHKLTPGSNLMSVSEIYEIARTFVDYGVKKIRLTGGEPMVRKDFPEIISSLSHLPAELSITTNATRLHEYSDLMFSFGIKSLNISLDTLDPVKFERITRRNSYDLVFRNLMNNLERFRVKVNVVIMKGINEDEILDFIELCRNLPIQVRFIEFMPFQGNGWSNEQVFRKADILEIIQEDYSLNPLPNGIHDTDEKFEIPGFLGNIAIISTISAPFCKGCNRLRLTADGKMKNCLFSADESDLLTPLRRGENIENIILRNVKMKQEKLGGQLGNLTDADANKIENRSMIRIGG